MICPKCQSPMEKVATAAGVVDRCTACKGMWFEIQEFEDQKAHAAIIDIGDAALGAQHNANDRIRCPVCANSPLIRMVDPQQPHIQFESCTVCYGRFFDAGEYRDLSELTLSDLYKRWTAKPRS